MFSPSKERTRVAEYVERTRVAEYVEQIFAIGLKYMDIHPEAACLCSGSDLGRNSRVQRFWTPS
jgi:hypothetical protein